MAVKIGTLMKRGRVAGTCFVRDTDWWVIVKTDGDGVRMKHLNCIEATANPLYRNPADLEIEIVDKEEAKQRFPDRWEQIAKQFPAINQSNP